MNTEQSGLPDIMDRHAILESLIERAHRAAERSAEAQDAVEDGRAYLRLLIANGLATRGELRRAARVIRQARKQARWTAAIVLTLQRRANILSAELYGTLAFPLVDGVDRTSPSQLN
jgi:hypothetical protein